MFKEEDVLEIKKKNGAIYYVAANKDL